MCMEAILVSCIRQNLINGVSFRAPISRLFLHLRLPFAINTLYLVSSLRA